MGMLQRFESRLEQVVSGAFARAFRSAVQPVELAAALQREVDNSAPDPRPATVAGAQHLRRRAVGTRLRAAVALRPDADHRARRHAPRARRASSTTSSPDRSRSSSPSRTTSPPAGSGCAASAAAQVIAETAVQRASARNAGADPRGQRQPGTRSRRPGSSSGAAPRRDLRINDPGVTRRHAEFRVTGRPRAHPRSSSSTSARPTAPWSTAGA